MTGKPGSLSVLRVGIAFASALLIWLLVVMVFVSRAHAAGRLRCYFIQPPLTRTEALLLTGRVLDCAPDNCRAIVNFLPERGTACYFPNPLPYNSPAALGQTQ